MSRSRDNEYRRESHDQLSKEALEFKGEMEQFKQTLIEYKPENKKRIESWKYY